jgi:hypothetical protein
MASGSSCCRLYRAQLVPGEGPVRLCQAYGAWLQELATRFEFVWATVWGAAASRLLVPLLQVPAFPMISFPPVPFHPRDKLPAIISYARHRPLAWADDEFMAEAHAWAAKRSPVTSGPRRGPTRSPAARLRRFALQWDAVARAARAVQHPPATS